MNDPFAMPDLALEDRVQALEMNLIDILRRIKLLEEQTVRTARSGDADTGRAGGDALTEQDAAAIVAAATTGIATAGSQDDDRVTRKPIQAPDGYDLGRRCPGEKCGGRGRIHDAERRCAECGGR